MRFVDVFIQNPVKVTVGVILLVLFGLLTITPPSIVPSPLRTPVQLTPNTDEPIVSVSTTWEGASPEEVEREIIDEQEDKLKGISNLRKMTSESSLGKGEITLEFYVGTNIDRALQEVSDKLRQVPEYPQDVDEPVITAADSADANAMAWIILYSDDESFDIQGFFDTAEKRVKPHLERDERCHCQHTDKQDENEN